VSPTPSCPIEHGGRLWAPHNRWDLVAARVDAAPLARTAVVVPYFEQPDSLRRMYAALAHLDPRRFELVVADDGSARPAPPPPSGYPLPTTIRRQDDRGCRPGAARNLAASAVDADVLVFLDADTVPAPPTVARLAAWPSVAPDALVVGRRGHVDLTGWSPAATVEWLAGRRSAPPGRRDPAWLADGYRRTGNLLDVDDRSYRFVISAVMACHRALWDDIGGFDASRDEYGGDDWEFASRAFNNGALLVHDPGAVAWHDEPDWSERDGSGKNEETLWLGRVIPEPGTRGTGIRQPWPDVLVTIDVGGASAGQVVATVADVLTAVPDVRIELVGEVAPGAARHLANDDRVRTTPPTDRQRQRARRVVRVRRPVRWRADGLRRVLDAVAPGGVGLVEIGDGHGATVASITSTRAAARGTRAARAGVAGDVVAALFGCRAAGLDEAGVEVLVGDVDLAATFGGW
jgi:GT2 family glycosyltransferase